MRKHPRIKLLSDKRVTLSPRESTDFTGFGLAHTYRLLREGTMPAIQVGKKFYIPKSSLLRWLENVGRKDA